MALRKFNRTLLFNGPILPGVAATVKLTGTNTLAALWSDEAGTIPLANPLINDPTYGTLNFFIQEGEYDFTFAKLGYDIPPLTQFTIGEPPLHTRIVVVSINGAPSLTTGPIAPAGARVESVFVTNAVGFGTGQGLTGYNVGDGATAEKWGANVPLTQGHKTTQADFTSSDLTIYPNGLSVLLSALGGTFDAVGQAVVECNYHLDQAQG